MRKEVITSTKDANLVANAELESNKAIADAIVDQEDVEAQGFDDIDDNVIEDNVIEDNADADGDLSFDSIEDSADDSAERSRDEIIADILSDKKHAKLFTGLRIKSVAANRNGAELGDGEHSFITFILKDKIFGMVASEELDALNRPIMKLGFTKTAAVSSYALSGMMKEEAELSVFSYDVVRTPEVANGLFAGGTADIIAHLIPAGIEYVNPFASNPTPTRFDTDKVLYYVINLQLGPIGLRKLEAYINK